MQFKIANKDVEPSQEGLLTLFFFGFFALLGLNACLSLIDEWRESKKSPDEKLKDKLDEMSSGTWLEPGNLDHFPTKFGMSDEESDKQNGGHFGPDPDKKNPNLTTQGIRFDDFKKAVEKLQKLSKFLASLGTTDDTIAKFDDMVKKTYTKDDFTYDDKEKKPNGLVFNKVVHKWPTSEFYQDADERVREMRAIFDRSKGDYKKIANKIGQIIKADTKSVPEKEMQNRVGYVKAAMMIQWIHADIVRSWIDNFYDLNEDLDVGWFEAEDGSFTYL